MVTIGIVLNQYGPEGTGAYTINTLRGNKAVLRGIARFDMELSPDLVYKKVCPPYVTRRTRAYREDILPPRFARKSFVEADNPVYLHKWNPQLFCNGIHGGIRYIAIEFLHILQHIDKLVRLTSPSFQYGIKRGHVK
jgi:hypothetical protein